MPNVVAAGRATHTRQVLCQVLHINTLAVEVAGWSWDWYPCGSQLLLPEQEVSCYSRNRKSVVTPGTGSQLLLPEQEVSCYSRNRKSVVTPGTGSQLLLPEQEVSCYSRNRKSVVTPGTGRPNPEKKIPKCRRRRTWRVFYKEIAVVWLTDWPTDRPTDWLIYWLIYLFIDRETNTQRLTDGQTERKAVQNQR